jgi:A/G-specific adenine glycosylase
MQRAARIITAQHGGQFPTAFEEVLDLPGIGRYTAGAICSIAFNQPRPILDGNVVRVLTRVFGIDGNPKQKSVNAKLWGLAEQLVQFAAGDSEPKQHRESPIVRISKIKKGKLPIGNDSRCSHLNQALMELGATVCTPRQPACNRCPVTRLCVARKQNLTGALPALPLRPRQTKRRFLAFVVQQRGRFLVRQRPSSVVNAHLWEFPNIEVRPSDGDPQKAALAVLGTTPSRIEHLCRIQHSITRYRIRLDALKVLSQGAESFSIRLGKWLTLREMHQLPFSSAHKRILALLGDEDCRPAPKTAFRPSV